MNTDDLPASWRSALANEFSSPWFHELAEFVDLERQQHEVFPPPSDVFQALRKTALADVRVLILGQDPYHDDGQAHGLSFSVRRGIKIPPSLRNIHKELRSDLSVAPPGHGCLESWASQGVLLLNTVLTVRAHEANSHRKKGWEQLTDRIIQCVSELPAVVFMLWGKPAQKKEPLIDSRHLILKSAHPSPLSAYNGFLGSSPFSRANAFLASSNLPAVDWTISDDGPDHSSVSPSVG